MLGVHRTHNPHHSLFCLRIIDWCHRGFNGLITTLSYHLYRRALIILDRIDKIRPSCNGLAIKADNPVTVLQPCLSSSLIRQHGSKHRLRAGRTDTDKKEDPKENHDGQDKIHDGTG